MFKYWAFTADALYAAIEECGAHFFDTCRDAGVKLYIVEPAVLNHKNAFAVPDSNIRVLMRYWHDLKDAPPFGYTNELVILTHLNQIHPDSVEVFVHNLYQYAWMNRTYSDDNIHTVNELKAILFDLDGGVHDVD